MVQNTSWEWLLEGFKFDLETQVKRKTVEYYYDHARLFVRWVQSEGRVSEPYLLTKRDIQVFLHHITQDPQTLIVGNGAVQQVYRTDCARWPYYRAIKRFFSWAVQEGYLKCNPLDGIVIRAPKPRPVEPYHTEHIEKMLSVLDYDWKIAKTSRQKMLAARDKVILMLFFESGLRLGELAGLKTADVDLTGQRAMVREGKMGKGRMVGFGPQTKKALWRYLGLRGDSLEHDALWITEEGRSLTKHGVQEIIRRLKRDAGLEHVKGSVHKLRHTFATIYLRHTRDMKGCRLLLGHSTLVMTERYTQFIEAEDALRAYDGKGPLDWMRT
jgi:site-specific recombinase XerD